MREQSRGSYADVPSDLWSSVRQRRVNSTHPLTSFSSPLLSSPLGCAAGTRAHVRCTSNVLLRLVRRCARRASPRPHFVVHDARRRDVPTLTFRRARDFGPAGTSRKTGAAEEEHPELRTTDDGRRRNDDDGRTERRTRHCKTAGPALFRHRAARAEHARSIFAPHAAGVRACRAYVRAYCVFVLFFRPLPNDGGREAENRLSWTTLLLFTSLDSTRAGGPHPTTYRDALGRSADQSASSSRT